MELIYNREDWNKKIKDYFNEYEDIYFKYEYFELFAKSFGHKPEALFWKDNNICVFWSHLVRKINEIDIFKEDNYYDLITPYGYGGPLISYKTENKVKVAESVNEFFEIYKKFALKNNYVSEFIRFHPIFVNWKEFEELFETLYLNDVVILDLTQNQDDICNNMAKKTRYYTRKALQDFERIITTDSPSEKEIEEFLNLYHDTMDKNKASSKYYFTKSFIKDHFDFKTLLIYCKNQSGVIGSSGLFLEGKSIIHYHLSSSNYQFKTSPARVVLWNAIIWAKEQGIKTFHFGGGRAKNDSLFYFKKGFSNTQIPFYIGKIIFNSNLYNELVDKNTLIQRDPTFFPLYRVGYDNTIV